MNEVCVIDGCSTKAWARGWCSKHYRRWNLHGDPLGSAPRVRADCSVKGCDRKASSRQLCKTHLTRLERSGTTAAYRPVIERFNLFVNSAGPDDCWEWLGPRNNKGYGKIGLLYAHRVACERAHGPAPDSEPFALHACDNPPCVNPRHLSWGTPSQNLREAWARTRRAR